MRDKDLVFVHKKILSCLLHKYDSANSAFRALTVNELAKECMFGKNKTKEHLDLLIKKGFVEKQGSGSKAQHCIPDRHLPKDDD